MRHTQAAADFQPSSRLLSPRGPWWWVARSYSIQRKVSKLKEIVRTRGRFQGFPFVFRAASSLGGQCHASMPICLAAHLRVRIHPSPFRPLITGFGRKLN